MSPIRMRKMLGGAIPASTAPSGISLQPFPASDPQRLHGLLVSAYAKGGGSVSDFDHWFEPMVTDAEFDPQLMLIAVDATERPLGLAHCWTSGFLKDLAVHPAYQNRQIGSWLLHQAFATIKMRGLGQLDLKVLADNAAARRFYARHGMVEMA